MSTPSLPLGIPENTIIGCANMAAKNISVYEYMDLEPYKTDDKFNSALSALQAFETEFKKAARSDLDPKNYALSRLFSKMDSFTKEGDDARGAEIYGQKTALTYEQLDGTSPSPEANKHWKTAVTYEKNYYLPHFFYRDSVERTTEEFDKKKPGKGLQIILLNT